MNKLFIILSLCFVFAGELEVEGDLKVTGNIEAGTIDNLEQEIAQLHATIAALQVQINYLSAQLGYTDCTGVIGGDAVLDECGVCQGDGTIDYYRDCNGDCYYDFDGDDICDIFEETDSVSDFDGNIYETVLIGEQIWMKENLRAESYQNGDQIEFDYYNNDPSIAIIYGNLYNWNAIDDSRGVCPEGFHVSSNEDWIVLAEYIINTSPRDQTQTGGELKECTIGYCPESEYWTSQNIGANNRTGFSALPAGIKYTDGSFSQLNYDTYFWSSTEGGYMANLYGNQNTFSYPSSTSSGGTNLLYGISVRCVQD